MYMFGLKVTLLACFRLVAVAYLAVSTISQLYKSIIMIQCI